MRPLFAMMFSAVTAGVLAIAGCTVKTAASDIICIADQRITCNDCPKSDPSDTQSYVGKHTCAHDGKSYATACEECAPITVPAAASSGASRPPVPPSNPDSPSNSPRPTETPPLPPERKPNDVGKECGPLAFGDLAIVEVMIASVAGGEDGGEWFEVQNTRDCRLNLMGLHIESPRPGNDMDTVNITTDTFLKPGESFIVADSTESHLPGRVFVWNAATGTVTRDSLNDHAPDSITLSIGDTRIDGRTYNPSEWSELTMGRSVSFPEDCAWKLVPNWTRWSYSNALYSLSPALAGTPNQPNTDVACQ